LGVLPFMVILAGMDTLVLVKYLNRMIPRPGGAE